jgi:hypothetical protein
VKAPPVEEAGPSATVLGALVEKSPSLCGESINKALCFYVWIVKTPYFLSSTLIGDMAAIQMSDRKCISTRCEPPARCTCNTKKPVHSWITLMVNVGLYQPVRA